MPGPLKLAASLPRRARSLLPVSWMSRAASSGGRNDAPLEDHHFGTCEREMRYGSCRAVISQERIDLPSQHTLYQQRLASLGQSEELARSLPPQWHASVTRHAAVLVPLCHEY